MRAIEIDGARAALERAITKTVRGTLIWTLGPLVVWMLAGLVVPSPLVALGSASVGCGAS